MWPECLNSSVSSVSAQTRRLHREGKTRFFSIYFTPNIFHVKLVMLWRIAEPESAFNYSYHGLYCLSRPLPAVFLHCHLPGCSRPHPLLHRGLRSLPLLGFLGLFRTPYYLPQPGVLDLLVSGKPGSTSGGDTSQMSFTACSPSALSFLATGAGKWDQSYRCRCRSSLLKRYTIKTCCEVADCPLTKLCSFLWRVEILSFYSVSLVDVCTLASPPDEMWDFTLKGPTWSFNMKGHLYGERLRLSGRFRNL